MEKNYKSIGLSGDFEIIIGSGKGCGIRLTPTEVPGISKKQAILKRIRDRLFIKVLTAKEGIFINGQRLPKKQWVEIIPIPSQPNEIKVGQTPIGIDAQLFRGRPRVGIATTPLYYAVAGKLICNGAYLQAKPGTITAIMGAAGCGKSTLLDLVSGYRLPDQGQVWINKHNESILVHQQYGQVREWLGYLPQDEVMIPELTVYQSLNYCLRLQFIDLGSEIRDHLIRQTAQSLGFQEEPRLEKFLHTVIGSVQAGIRGLSGGERKRANLAHELIAMPLILLLDEPTSGLSSVDADNIMELLQRLTKQQELTTIITIHQPSRDTFKDRFDNLLLMNQEGSLAYYGPSQQASPYFQKITATEAHDRNPAEYLLEILNNSDYNQKITQAFAQDRNQPEFSAFITPPSL
jgi:ABC-type multidrug transport system ATPase subunit